MMLNALATQQIDAVLAACMPLDWNIEDAAPPEPNIQLCRHPMESLILRYVVTGQQVACRQCGRWLDETEYERSYARYQQERRNA